MKKFGNSKKIMTKLKPVRNSTKNSKNEKQKQVYKILKSTTYNLNERVKELNCLYNIFGFTKIFTYADC